MIYENILAIYANDEATDTFIKKEKDERNTFLATIDRLKELRDTDPDAFDEMIAAIKLIQAGEEQIDYLPYNKFVEYGLGDNTVISEAMERQQRILAIVHSNKDLASLSEAVDAKGV